MSKQSTQGRSLFATLYIRQEGYICSLVSSSSTIKKLGIDLDLQRIIRLSEL